MSTSGLNEIAITGLAGRFPGARHLPEFWQGLVAGQEGISQLTDAQLAEAGYDPAALRRLPGFVGARGLLDRPEWFDRAFFGMSAREAEVMDPQQRVLLELAWEALEDAGCDPARYPGLIGVCAGMSNNTYYQRFVQPRRDLVEAVGHVQAILANEKDFLATRLAYKLDLRGPALSVYTACSSSLVAVAVACRQLQQFECDAVLAGGVSITFPHVRGYLFEEGGMTSPDGHCRPFSAEAAGTVFSHGAGLVVLKRLEDAVAEGDQIYAVIRGQALNNDGAGKVSFAAPSSEGQAEVIALAQALAEVTPEQIGYVEAHGTGTPLGDPIEIAGLAKVFGPGAGPGTCWLGSLKGHTGHLDAASGVAGLIKATLALRHEAIPPTLHAHPVNPALHLEETPFRIPAQLQPWPRSATPRYAGVSSFGVGGTNAHVILAEAPLPVEPPPARGPLPLVLSARSAEALEQRAADLALHLEKCPELSLAAVASTLATGRQLMPHRRALLAGSTAEAAALLREPAALQRVDERTATPVAFLFPGQGSQYAGMGLELHRENPAFRAALEECAALLTPLLPVPLPELLARPDLLAEARYSQPALFAVDYAVAQSCLALGLEPAALVGHSLGEFVAAVLAGIMTLPDAARLVARRAELVAELPRGAMLAVRLSEAEATALLTPGVDLAAVNGPQLCVLSGPEEAIAAVEQTCRERHLPALRLASSHAFHSAMVEPLVPRFREAVAAIPLSAPRRLLISSVTGEVLTEEEATSPDYWAGHLRATVRFGEALNTLLRRHEGAVLECGPGQALTQLARQAPAKAAHHVFTHTLAEGKPEGESTARALAQLWLAGVPLRWEALFGGLVPRVSLPTYPFQRQRYFADLPPGVPLPITTSTTDGYVEQGFAAASPAPAASAEPLPEPDPTRPLVSEPAAAEPPAPSVSERVRTLLADLSGNDFREAPSSATMLELGFDSLFLSQAAISLTRGFGVKVTFRQLLKELGTLGALIAHLEAHAPAQPLAPAAPTTPASLAPAAAPLAAGGSHGPFRPLRRETESELTPAQEEWLRAFIARYTARTAGSKGHTEEYRSRLSDPRAVAGFKQLWKEMVYPIVVGKSAGQYLWDIDGNQWNDVTLSFGAAMLGHQPPYVIAAAHAQLDLGLEIGPTSPLAGEVATLLCETVGHERVTFCNTGSEAVSGAVRVARTVSGRPKVVYFAGAYHGITDEVLGRRGGAGAVPIAPGIPREALSQALILDYGQPEALQQIAAQAEEIAAVLVEPVQSRRPDLQPAEFLRELRELTTRHGIALIFDEIVTGFRSHPGGAQGWFGIRADLAVYGKVLGGGIPIGAICGRAEYMDAFDGGAWRFGDDSFPSAAMTFFAGTFVRHPLALAAARAVLLHLRAEGQALQQRLSATAEGLVARLRAVLAGSPFHVPSFGSNWYLTTAPDFHFPSLLYALLRFHGVHIWENRPCFICTEHTAADLDHIVSAFEKSIAELESVGFFARTGAEPALAPAPAAPSTRPPAEGQREVWMLCQQSPLANAACNESWLLHLQGPLRPELLQGSLQAVVERHESLRSTFSRSGEELRVALPWTQELPVQDLSTLPESEQEARLHTAARAEAGRPFILEKAPLFTAQLFRLAPERHVFLFNAHHSVCDGWSCDVFLRELAEGYSARHDSRAPALPAPTTPLAYQQWEEALHHSEEGRADAAWWLERYRTIPAALEIAGDHPRPRFRTDAGASEINIFPADFARRLQQFGARQGATLFSVLLAGWQILLQKLSGQREIVVGVPSAGQSLMGVDHLIAHCVNLLPLRLHAAAGESFAQVLERAQGENMEAFEHRSVTFGWLLRQLTLPRDPGRVPLVSTTFNLDPPLGNVRFSGLEHRLQVNGRAAYQFDLGLNCDTFAEGFRVICHYNTDLYEAGTIRQWVQLYREILEGAMHDPGAPLPEKGEAAPEVAPVAAPEPAPAPAAAAPALSLWPSSPAAGGDQVYDDVLYNAMATDVSRHHFFREAFARTVRDRVVVDVGTGRDAVLARYCLDFGARKVYAIELVPWAARHARELVEKLGLSERLIVLEGRSQEVSLPEKADVLVSENIGNIGSSEGGDLMLADARERFLRPGGLIIPARCRTRIAAVSLPPEFLAHPVLAPLGAHYTRECWKEAGYRYDVRMNLLGATRALLASDDAVFEDLTLGEPGPTERRHTATLHVERAARVDGFLLWLQLEGVPGEAIESIDYADSWLPVYFPAFDEPVAVEPGDLIHLEMTGTLAGNGFNRDYHVQGRVESPGGRVIPFSYHSWHYRQSYHASAFYRRLFAGDEVPVAGERGGPLPAASTPAVPPATAAQPSARLPAPAEAKSAGGAPAVNGSARPGLFLISGTPAEEADLGGFRSLAAHLPLHPLALARSAVNGAGLERGAAARALVAALRGQQPAGPYHLAGTGAGGLLAYEVARQLSAQGETVESLLIFEAAWPGTADSAGGGASWHRLWQRVASRSGAPAGDPFATLERQLLQTPPEPYSGPVTLVLPREEYQRHGDRGWLQGHPGPLELAIIPGQTGDYRQHPELAARLQERLAAQAGAPARA